MINYDLESLPWAVIISRENVNLSFGRLGKVTRVSSVAPNLSEIYKSSYIFFPDGTEPKYYLVEESEFSLLPVDYTKISF